MTHLSLFTGIGGLDLAAEWAGFQTVGQCEWADYPTKVLEKHWPDVPRWRDIRTLTGESFYERTGLRELGPCLGDGGYKCTFPVEECRNHYGGDCLKKNKFRINELHRPSIFFTREEAEAAIETTERKEGSEV